MLIDAHTHFQTLGDVVKVQAFLDDSFLKDIRRVLNATVDPSEWELIRAMGLASDKIVPFYGIHPWKVLEAPADWRGTIAQLLRENPLAGVGETGLDKVRKDIDLARQKEVFAGQLQLAHEFGRPFVVHCVRAWDWTVRLIEQSQPTAPFILHFFNGPKEIMEKLVRLGGYISFNARQMDRSDDRVRDMMKLVPLDRLLLETDFPYLGPGLEPAMPEQYVGRLRTFYAETARIKEISIEQLSETILQNGTVFTDRTSSRA